MKQIFLFLVLTSLIAQETKAAPGDTTWVQAHHDKWLNYFNNFDTTITFPDNSKTYRKVYMVFTLGKYVCPGSPQYCSDWDYTVQNFVMTPSGDTFEIGRLITPYGKGNRMPADWKGRYIYDVTDFSNVLRNNATVRIHYSGYSGGFTANIRFAFIEGTPERNIIGLERVWNGSFAFGNTSNPIENKMDNRVLYNPAGTAASELKFTVTGHGADNTEGCSEFCSKYYDVKLNAANVAHTDIWRDDCGNNWLYPQSGTWIFDRGGWCPGDLVKVNSHYLPGLQPGNSYNLDVDFQPYTGSGGASYSVQSYVAHYGLINKTLDAAMVDIIAPTDFEGHYRENPTALKPVIKVRNTGKTMINSIKFSYGVTGKTLQTYTWNGNLDSLKDMEIVLPTNLDVRNADKTDINGFEVTILEVNGATDADVTNNKLTSTFYGTPVWPKKFVFVLKTNGAAFGGFSETNWQVFDENNNVVAQSMNNNVNTTYNDTLDLPEGAYTLKVSDAGNYGGDGLSWWYYQNYNPNPGNGSFKVTPATSILPLSIPTYFGGDFGSGFTQSFKNFDPATSIDDIKRSATMYVVPNPANDHIRVTIGGITNTKGTVILYDLSGKMLQSKTTQSSSFEISVADLVSGTYIVDYRNEANSGARIVQRIVVQH